MSAAPPDSDSDRRAMAEGACEAQLRALFAGYARHGQLDAAGLQDLCAALPGGRALQARLAAPVPFPAFRQALLALLHEQQQQQQREPELSDDSSGRELSPKCTLGAKRYGRRSRPRADDQRRLRRCISFPDQRRAGLDSTEPSDPTASRSLDPAINLDLDNCGNGDALGKSPFPVKLVTRHIFNPTDKPLLGEMSKLLNLRSIADMWESAGIRQPYTLLEDLGFKDENLKYLDLLNVLEEETRHATTNSDNTESNFSLTLFRAILCLYRWETSNVKTALNQALAERDKAKSDLTDANRRAVLLANEVDENHAKLETTSKSQIKVLERKHSEAIQRLTVQLDSERDLNSATISNLEERLSTTQGEEAKLRLHLENLETINDDVEREKNHIKELLSESTETNRRLTKELKTLELQKLNKCDCAESNKTTSLELKIANLQSENTHLRDKNDEINVELERSKIELRNLSENLLKCRTECSNLSERIPSINGIKRQSASPTPSSDEESPRIRKLRKCRDASDKSAADNLASASSLTDKHRLNGTSKTNLIDDRLTDTFTTEILNNFIRQIEETKCDKLANLMSKSDNPRYYLLLFYIFGSIKEDFVSAFGGEFIVDTIFNELKLCLNEMNGLDRERIFNTVDYDKLTNGEKCETNSSNSESDHLLITIEKLNKLIEKERKERDEEESKHVEKCKEYENNIESLKNVYEECEEYWASKFKEERDIYDQEQQINDEKFADLMTKVTEYEEQFGSPDTKNDNSRPLSTIEEKFSLEKQYTDLEEEFQEYKTKMELELEARDEEIEELKNKANSQTPEDGYVLHRNNFSEINIPSSSLSDVNVATNPKSVMNDFDKPGAVDDLGPISSPIEYLWNQKTISPPMSNIQTNNDKIRDYHNPVFSKDQKSNDDVFAKSDSSKNDSYNNEFDKNSSSLPSPTLMNQDSNVFGKCLNTRMEGKILHCSELEETLQGRKRTVPNMNAEYSKCNEEMHSLNNERENATIRMAMLEIRYRQLQTAFRHYQIYSEDVLHRTVIAHRNEIGALHQKLAAADILVRDLYVENCHLTGSIHSPAL